MTPTTNELRALVERLDNTGVLDGGAKMAYCMRDAAAALRQWIAERERCENDPASSEQPSVIRDEKERCSMIVRKQWNVAVREFGLKPNNVAETVVARILDEIYHIER